MFCCKKALFPAVLVIIIVLAVFMFKNGPVAEEQKETVYKADQEELLMEKIGQMLMIGFRGTEAADDSYIAKAIQDLKLGGVVLFDYDVPSQSFPRNIVNKDQLKKLIEDMQSYSLTPLFVAVDAEGGAVNRLKPAYGFPEILSAKELGRAKNYEIVEKEALKLAQVLKEAGFNMNLAPVVDLDINPENPIIGSLGRSFSADPKEVTDYARAFIRAHYQNNVIAVAKHFPGHGSSFGDSHLGMVDVTESYQEKELVPYYELNQENLLKAVMTAHIVNKKIDQDYPATLSPFFLKDLLRQVIGFEGVIISDDIQMEAITDHYGLKEATIRAVNAGVDILLIANNSPSGFDSQLPYKARDIIYQAVKEGEIPKERIFESADRIYKLKKDFEIIK